MLDIQTSNCIVAKQLKEIISSKGIKQFTVATKAGFTAQEFSDMLNGRRLIRVVDIAKILSVVQEYGIDANYLFGIKAEKGNKLKLQGRTFKEILVLTDNDELIASITDENVIEKDGYKVVSVPNVD